jgi:hypothetical protein
MLQVFIINYNYTGNSARKPFGTQEFHNNYIGISQESVHLNRKNIGNRNFSYIPKGT